MSACSISSAFSPSEALAAQILDSIASPDLTLRDIAVEANTTLESLVLWLAIPEIAERLSNLESAIARRTRLVATNTLPYVVKTLSLIVEEHNREESKVPLRTDSLKHLEQRRRARETARRAGSLLLRLAGWHCSPSRDASDRRWHRSPTGVLSDSRVPRRSEAGSGTPSQREGAGGGLRTADRLELIASQDQHDDPVPSPSAPSVTIPLTAFLSLFAAPRQRLPITTLHELAPNAAESADAVQPGNQSRSWHSMLQARCVWTTLR